MLNRALCEQLDRDDPLAAMRDAFELAPDLIYLDGNSLGPLPKAAKSRAREVIDREWGRDLIRSWNQHDWFQLPQRVGGKVAELIGAGEDEVVVTDSVGINLYKVLCAALNLQPTRKIILMEGSNFPSNNYIGQGIASASQDREVKFVEFAQSDQLLDALNEQVAVLCLTHVHYRTGRIHDMATITARAQELGIVVVWDLCHSTGALPVDLNGCHVDFAVGCTYKYLNGGPGSPAYLFAARRHHGVALQPITGWWGHDQPFALYRDYAPAAGVNQMLTGTQPVISLAVAEVGIDLFLEVDIKQVRQKSVDLCDLFIELVESRCPDAGFRLISPGDSNERGSQVSFDHTEGYAVMRALIDHQVIGDFRAPATMRFGFTPLYTRYVDVWDAVERLCVVMEAEMWREPRYQERGEVT